MNSEPTPLEPEQLDELLSADLDDELDAAARELGLSVEDARARMRATEGADDRRGALIAARDLLGVTPPMDELLEARLRAKAVRAGEAEHAVRADERRRRRNRILLSAGSIAAAVAAIVAVANGVSGFHPNSASDSKSAASPSPSSSADRPLAPTTEATNAPAALGSFTDVHALAVAAVRKDAASRALPEEHVRSLLGPDFAASDGRLSSGSTVPGPSQNATSSSPDKVDSQKSSSGGSAQDQGQNLYDSAGAAASCKTPPQVPADDSPVLRATATLAGKPVVVLVFANATEHIVVIEDLACRLVNLQMFR